MKIKFCVIFAIMFFGLQGIKAQDSVRGSSGTGEMMFGAKTGLNVSTFLGRDYVDITPLLGAYVGGIAEIPAFMDNFYLQPEFLLSFQGADIGPDNLKLTYLHLPIMAKYHITDQIAAEFGPQIGFLLGDNSEDFALPTKGFHAGVNFGGGYRLNENFYFQVRFGLGLSKILDINDNKTRNGVLSIGACYFF